MISIHARMKGRAAIRLASCALGLLALLAWAGGARAGSDERKGTGGATELRIPVGPRGNALGGSIVGDATGIESAYWNPAGLATIERTDAMFSNVRYFADMRVNYFALATHVGDIGTIGVQVKALSVGDILVTTEAAPEGTGEVITPTFTVIGGSWARQFTDRVRFGTNVNIVNERIQNMSANGVAFDLGVQYVTGWRNMTLGLVMKNFGTSMAFDGPGLETSLLPANGDPTASNRIFRSTSSSFEMPSYFNMAASYDLMQGVEQRVKLHASFQNNNFSGDNVSAGLEWNYRNVFALRGSYLGTFDNQVDAISGAETTKLVSGDDLYGGLAFGVGANVKLGGSKLGFDLSWRQTNNFFDDIIETGLRLQF